MGVRAPPPAPFPQFSCELVITATQTHGGPEYYGPLRDFLHARGLAENGGQDPREPVDFQALLVELKT